MLRIFNTLSRKKEILKNPKGKTLKLFVCGPTVYDYSHIGHARTYIAFDTIVRYLRSQKLKIFYLQNITDVDDKIIDRAKLQKSSPEKVARNFEKEYYRDMKTLGIISVDKYARATDYIPEIVKQVKTLIKKGNAYEIPGDGWYFNLATFPEYGKLSHRTASQAEDAVSRIDESSRKRNKGDFALWKFSQPGEPSWKTELGTGRPGWHIEDTAISEKFFGPQYDLHGGAVDLKFPHHEAEIAQQESASGKKPFVKIWLHTGFLLVNGEKMSKSLGNFITIRDFLKEHSSSELHWIVASHHYRSPIDYTPCLAEQAKASLQKLNEFLARLNLPRKTNGVGEKSKSLLKTADADFRRAMEDDFNTPDALAALFRLINGIEPKIWVLTKKEAQLIKNAATNHLKIFGINLKTDKIPLKISQMAQKRELLRSNKQFAQADALRKEIEALGFSIEDTPAGPLVLK